MIEKFLIVATCSIIADIVSGCKQVSVSRFANENKITDYDSTEDD